MTQRSVTELRQILVNSGKYTKDEAENIKGKSKLSELVLNLEDDVDVASVFANVEVETETQTQVVQETKSDVPHRLSPDWQSYVLSQFNSDELEDGKYPLLPGLRRVAEKLLGKIVYSMPEEVNTRIDDRNPTGYTTCTYKIVFENGFGQLMFGSAASSHRGNTDDDYAVYPEAIAETRAEARTLRKALNLKVVSKDELTSKNIREVISNLENKEAERNGTWSGDDLISTPQKLMIEKMSERLNIDVTKLLEKENLNTNLSEIKKEVATKVIELLNKYQSNAKDSIVIPEEIKKG